jgi:predicted amidohydrolase YtcJ
MVDTWFLVRRTGGGLWRVNVPRPVVGDILIQDGRHHFVGSREGMDGVATPELTYFRSLLVV